jgi:hypothetical protein
VVLSVKGKTGEREVIARDFAVNEYFDRIRAMREAETNRKLKGPGAPRRPSQARAWLMYGRPSGRSTGASNFQSRTRREYRGWRASRR